MSWLVDGSNVLGAMRLDRESTDAKRELARLCAAFARAKRTRVTCYFDGAEPPSFARHLGNTTIVFSGRQTADELIARNASNATVVTSDAALARRVAGRRVRTMTAQEFVQELRAVERSATKDDEDWAAYFSDPKNRQEF